MKNLLLFFTLFVPGLVFSQDVLENNPPSLKWYQVNTPHFRVIFPKGFEIQGQRVANTLEHIRKAESKTLGSYPARISVILQNQAAVSNGFVSVLPRRSEFYAMPPQDYNFLGTNDWLDLLASHEYRHIVQYQHAKRGFNRLFYYLFGATTFAGMAQVAAPDWFWEGDAVVAETAFTPSGRGKIPNFGLVFRTNLMEGREFNYHKQYLRSYKHNIPDHYVLGYHMVSYLRKKTNDPEIWGKITARSWSVPFIPFTFSNAVKKESGLYVTKLYKEMVQDLKQEWQLEIDKLQPTSFTKLNVTRHRTYTDFLYPRPLDIGSVLVLKKGIGNIEEFVILKDGKEEKVFIPGFINDSGMISAQGSFVVWNEYGYDPRWSVRNYSLIKAYDLKNKKYFIVGDRKGRYGSASLSPDQTKLVSVRTGTDYRTEIVVLSFPKGEVLHTFPNAENYFYSMPRWSDAGDKIVALKTVSGDRSVVLLDPANNKEQEVIAPSGENIGYPVLSGNYLLYNSPVTGIDNIYAIDLSSDNRFQITSSKYGAYNPGVTPDGKTIYYNEQTKDGLDVVKIPFDPLAWRTFEKQNHYDTDYEHLVEQEGHPQLFDSVPETQLPVTRFSKGRGIINPYSWGFFVDNNLTEANIGISSQDLLSTTKIDLGYSFDISERTSSWGAGVSYQGLFPIIDVSGSISNRSVNEATDEQAVTFKWLEKNVEAGIRVPLITTSSRFIGNVSVGNAVGVTNVSGFVNSVDGGGRIFQGSFFREYIDDGNLLYNNFNLDAYRLMKRSRRDINHRWGQRIEVNHFSTPYKGDFNGQLFAATGRLYFPGFTRHHSFWGFGAFQYTKVNRMDDNYIFRNEIPLPRGHSVSRFQQFYSASANYTLPIWYPDIAIGPLLNIQRLRANVFFDYGLGITQLANFSKTYTSVGIEGKIDINILRFLPQLDIGVRYSQGIEPARSKFEILIGTINF